MVHQYCSYVWYDVGAKFVFSCPVCFSAGGLYAPCNTSHQGLQQFLRRPLSCLVSPSAEDLKSRSEKNAGETRTLIIV